MGMDMVIRDMVKTLDGGTSVGSIGHAWLSGDYPPTTPLKPVLFLQAVKSWVSAVSLAAGIPCRLAPYRACQAGQLQPQQMPAPLSQPWKFW